MFVLIGLFSFYDFKHKYLHDKRGKSIFECTEKAFFVFDFDLAEA